MEVDRVTKGLGPEPRRSSCLSSEGCCKHIDGTNGALGDGVEVMVVRRARGRMKRRFCPEFIERERLELSLVVTVESAHLGPREWLTVFPDWYAYERVELGYGPFRGVDDLVLSLEELHRNEPGVLVDEEGGVSVRAEE